MNLNEYFDVIVCLAVDKRAGQYDLMSRLETRCREVYWFWTGNGSNPNIEYDYIDSADIPNGWQGSAQSYNYYHCIWNIIRLAMAKKATNLLFFEDDAWIQPDFNDVLDEVMQTIIWSGLEWDMLYLGANHHASATQPAVKNLIKCSCALDMHCVAINQTMFGKILQLQQNMEGLNGNPYCDVTIAHLFHKTCNVYAIYPSIVYQYPGFSENEQCYLDRVKNWQHPGLLMRN